MSAKKSYLSRYCFVPRCQTGYVSDIKLKKERGEVYPSMFKGPKDAIMLQQWQRAIPRADKTFGMNDVVCSLHFPEEDILRFYETKLADGTINRIERGKPKLKEGSVPRIFPNLPSYLSNIKKKRKPPRERTKIVDVKRRKYLPSPDPVARSVTQESTSFNEFLPKSIIKVEQNRKSPCKQTEIVEIKRRDYLSLQDPVAHSGTQVESTSFNEFLPKIIIEEISDNLIDVKSEITEDGSLKFEDLKISLNKICTSNKQWSGTFIPGKDEVVFAEWDDAYNAKKKIVIRQDMTFKVLLGKSRINFDNNTTILSFDELENIIESINKMRVCGKKILE